MFMHRNASMFWAVDMAFYTVANFVVVCYADWGFSVCLLIHIKKLAQVTLSKVWSHFITIKVLYTTITIKL